MVEKNRRLHPCICGFMPANFAQSERHRKKCEHWKNRPDPRKLSGYRKSQAKKLSQMEKRRPGLCDCGRYVDHIPPCPFALKKGLITEHRHGGREKCDSNLVRVLMVVQNDIDLRWFEKFLTILAKRFEGRRQEEEFPSPAMLRPRPRRVRPIKPAPPKQVKRLKGIPPTCKETLETATSCKESLSKVFGRK